jgi:hypothetical protein
MPRRTARRGLDLLFYVNLGMQTAWASRMVRDRVFRRSSRKAGGQSPFARDRNIVRNPHRRLGVPVSARGARKVDSKSTTRGYAAFLREALEEKET